MSRSDFQKHALNSDDIAVRKRWPFMFPTERFAEYILIFPDI